MTEKWYDIDKHSPDPKEGLTKEGDLVLLYGDGFVMLGKCREGAVDIVSPENFEISHWQIARLPGEELNE